MEKRKRRSFTKEYKAEVVELIRKSGKSIGAIAKELDLTETAVRARVRRGARTRDQHRSRFAASLPLISDMDLRQRW